MLACSQSIKIANSNLRFGELEDVQSRPGFVSPRALGSQLQEAAPMDDRFFRASNFVQFPGQMKHHVWVIRMMIQCTLERGNRQLMLAHFYKQTPQAGSSLDKMLIEFNR